jgi:hypothetical protein
MDLLAKLYELPEPSAALKNLQKRGISIRRGLAPEKLLIVDWVRSIFSASWASECDVAFSRSPISCFIAVEHNSLLGFACYDVTCKNFFGPTGVDPDQRNGGIGKALLLASLQAMASEGYAYAIIGGVGPVAYYKKIVNAIEIPDSTPGIYRGLLK